MKTQQRSGVQSGYDDIATNLGRLGGHAAPSDGAAATGGTISPMCMCGCGGMPQFHHATSSGHTGAPAGQTDDFVLLGKKGPSMADEVAFINGVKADGTITSDSYWGSVGKTAYKWGGDQAGSAGGTVKYYFDPASNWTAQEKTTWLKGFSMWAGVADIKFEETSSLTAANVSLRRGNDGGAYTSLSTSRGSGEDLGHPTARGLISIDTHVAGFELTGSFDTYGGYGLSSVIHEIGHLIGLGHGGAYNGNVDPATQQNSAFDDRMYSIMSYIYWGETDAKFLPQNPYQNTNWGETNDGIDRQAPHSIMQLDIEATQQLYGVSQDSPFEGGQTYGFHSNIQGVLHDFFDFTKNTDPVVTLYNQGTGNTLDLSGYSDDQRIDLHGGAFSDVGGHTNNVAIAQGTVIDFVIGGSGDDTILASDAATSMTGGKGLDTLSGGAAADLFAFDDGDSGKKAKVADDITNFSHAQGDKIDLSAIDAIKGGGDSGFTFIGSSAFSGDAGELRFIVKGGNLSLMGDVDGDGKADFTIHFDHVTTLVQGDLVL